MDFFLTWLLRYVVILCLRRMSTEPCYHDWQGPAYLLVQTVPLPLDFPGFNTKSPVLENFSPRGKQWWEPCLIIFQPLWRYLKVFHFIGMIDSIYMFNNIRLSFTLLWASVDLAIFSLVYVSVCTCAGVCRWANTTVFQHREVRGQCGCLPQLLSVLLFEK